MLGRQTKLAQECSATGAHPNVCHSFFSGALGQALTSLLLLSSLV